MIVIEGTDLVGKTYLCNRIMETDYAREKDLRYEHYGPLPVDHDRCWDYKKDIEHYVLLDRFYYSEIAYRTVENAYDPNSDEPNVLTDRKARVVESLCRLNGLVLVVLVAESHLLKRRYDRQVNSELFSLSTIQNVNLLFNACAQDFGADLKVLVKDDLSEEATSELLNCVFKLHEHRLDVVREGRDL